MRKWIAICVVPLGLGLAVAAWGGDFQDPDEGSPPMGMAFSDDAEGARVNGAMTLCFEGTPQLCVGGFPQGRAAGAPALTTILRLRKASKLRAYAHRLTCSDLSTCTDDPCTTATVCVPCDPATDAACNPLTGLKDGVASLVAQSEVGAIQGCLVSALRGAIAGDLIGKPDGNVRIKNVEEFVGPVTAGDPASLAPIDLYFVADVELSVK